MQIIQNYTDIQNYVSNNSPAGVVAVGGDAEWRVVTAIARADHPAYGEDWAGWLDENAERIALFALGVGVFGVL